MSVRALLKQNSSITSSVRAFTARPSSSTTTFILARKVFLPAMPSAPLSTSASIAVERPKSSFGDVTWKSFLTYEPELNALADSKYRNLASDDTIEKTKKALEDRGFKVHVVNNKDEAFQKVVSLIPAVRAYLNEPSCAIELHATFPSIPQPSFADNIVTFFILLFPLSCIIRARPSTPLTQQRWRRSESPTT